MSGRRSASQSQTVTEPAFEEDAVAGEPSDAGEPSACVTVIARANAQPTAEDRTKAAAAPARTPPAVKSLVQRFSGADAKLPTPEAALQQRRAQEERRRTYGDEARNHRNSFRLRLAAAAPDGGEAGDDDSCREVEQGDVKQVEPPKYKERPQTWSRWPKRERLLVVLALAAMVAGIVHSRRRRRMLH